MFEQYFLQISPNSEMAELEPFVELTQNDPIITVTAVDLIKFTSDDSTRTRTGIVPRRNSFAYDPVSEHF